MNIYFSAFLCHLWKGFSLGNQSHCCTDLISCFRVLLVILSVKHDLCTVAMSTDVRVV